MNPNYQERISEQSRQRLRDAWVIEDPRDMVRGGIAWPRARMERERGEDLCVSPRSNFGMFLKRAGVLPDLGEPLKMDDVDQIILSLFRCLKLCPLRRFPVRVGHALTTWMSSCVLVTLSLSENG